MNIYVGNLHYDITEDRLKEIFGEYGEVSSVKIISDKYSGRSKGFGFIEMTNDDEGTKAVEGLDGQDEKGRRMKVNKARERTDNPRD